MAEWNSKKVIITGGLALVLIFSACISLFYLTAPIKSDNLSCEYSLRYNKTTCTEYGDVVPSWLKLDDTYFASLVGIGTNYTMQLILSKKDGTYRTLNMTDKNFIMNLKRQFIYELKEQTPFDYYKLKKDLKTSSKGHWGSVVLYCSDSNLNEDVCKKMQQYSD